MTDLTKTEQYILDKRLEKQPFKAIAEDLGLTLGAVAQYHSRAQDKLGARTFKGALLKWKAWRRTNIEFYTPGINPRGNTSSSST